MQWLRRNFIAGFFVTVPLFISVAALVWIFRLVDEATQIIRGDLASQGYLQPMVAVNVRDEGATKTLDISVTPGVRSTQTVIRISGADETLFCPDRWRVEPRNVGLRVLFAAVVVVQLTVLSLMQRPITDERLGATGRTEVPDAGASGARGST